MRNLTTVSALRRSLPDFDWSTLRFQEDGTMIVASKQTDEVYAVAERVWRSPSSPFHDAAQDHDHEPI